MDNLTHSLACLALARAGGKRLGRYATGLLIVGGNAPDIDAVTRISSSITYLAHHRGITHSFVFAPVLAAAVMGLFYGIHRARGRSEPFGFARAFLLALVGVVFGHLVLDWTTSYGTRLLLPFSGRWLAWDAVPIIDVPLLFVMIAAFTVPYLFRLISDEIGARRSTGRGGAVFALIFLVLWFSFRGVLHSRAVATLEAHTYRGLQPDRTAAFADLVNPFRWHAVVETSESYERAEMNLLQEFDPTATRSYFKPEVSPALDAARGTHTAGVFLDFARFPFSYAEQVEDGWLVVFRDLRFDYGLAGSKGFVVRVRLDRQMRVLEENFTIRPSEAVR